MPDLTNKLDNLVETISIGIGRRLKDIAGGGLAFLIDNAIWIATLYAIGGAICKAETGTQLIPESFGPGEAGAVGSAGAVYLNGVVEGDVDPTNVGIIVGDAAVLSLIHGAAYFAYSFARKGLLPIFYQALTQ